MFIKYVVHRLISFVIYVFHLILIRNNLTTILSFFVHGCACTWRIREHEIPIKHSDYRLNIRVVASRRARLKQSSRGIEQFVASV